MERTPEELKVLFEKFDNDVQKRTRFMRFLLVFDQTFNVLIWNGSQDETISSHISRKIKAGTATKFDKLVCCFLKRLESEHCLKSEGE
jgi:hypothetical protein